MEGVFNLFKLSIYNVCQTLSFRSNTFLSIIKICQPYRIQTPWGLMFSYLFCLSRVVISAPRSSSSWQIRGWHIWVASTRGVLPSWRKIKYIQINTHTSTSIHKITHNKVLYSPKNRFFSPLRVIQNIKSSHSRCSEYLFVLLTMTIHAVHDCHRLT